MIVFCLYPSVSVLPPLRSSLFSLHLSLALSLSLTFPRSLYKYIHMQLHVHAVLSCHVGSGEW